MFYTYLYLREDGTPYYVGKGSGNRAFTSAGHRTKVPPRDRIIIYPAESEADAFETEVALVWYYGRKDLGTGCLRNLTHGGENPPNWKGKKRSVHQRESLSAARKGLAFSKETKQRMSKAAKARLIPGRLGKTCSEEMRRRISETLSGRKLSKETCALLSELRKGKTLSTKGKPWTTARREAQLRKQNVCNK